MKVRIASLRMRLLVQLLPVVLIAVGLVAYVSITNATDNARQASFDHVAGLAQENANAFNASVEDGQAVGRTLAAIGESHLGGNREQVNRVVKRTFERNPGLIGAYIGYVPNGFDGVDARFRGTPGADGKGRFGPYWNTLAGDLVVDPLVDQEASDYWNLPKETGKDAVVEPYLYEGTLLTSYTSPVADREGNFVGIGGVDRPLASIDEAVSRVKVLDSGYAMVVSNGGIFVAAPDKELIGTKTLADLAKEKDNAELAQIAKAVAAGKAAHVETTDPFTGKEVVYFTAPVSAGKWGYVGVAPMAEVMAEANALRNKLLVISLLVLLGAAAVIAFVAARIAKPVQEVTAAAERLATGDVDITVDYTSEDEVGRMARAFAAIVAYLREIASSAERVAAGDLTVQVEPKSEQDLLGRSFQQLVGDLAGVMGDVSGTAGTVSAASQEMAATSQEAGRAVGEIASAIGEVAQGAERQARQVDDIKGTAEQTARSARDSAERAEQAAEAAGKAREVAQDGARAAGDASEAMDAVAQSSAAVTDAISGLATKSEEIGTIVETISGIAEQTNLLALNAAIAAARAGEQGRGFAVVADEVRKLAEGSQAAAGDIAKLIEDIQAGTRVAVNAVQESGERSEDGGVRVAATRTAFEDILGAVDDVTDRVQQIAQAASSIAADAERMQVDILDVAAVSEQSSANTEEVSASTEQTSASAQQIAASAQELSRTADELERLVGRFTLAR